ncbi:unnamed protein product [Caretta caretta]
MLDTRAAARDLHIDLCHSFSAVLRGRWRAETKETRGERTGQGWEAGTPADEGTGDGHSLPLDTRFLAGSTGQLAKGEDSVGNAKGDGTDNTTGILGAAEICLNRGTPNATECICRRGWTGCSCECFDPMMACQNGGTAIGCICFCPPGYSGERCDCRESCQACQNGGTPVGMECTCPQGTGGPRCEYCNPDTRENTHTRTSSNSSPFTRASTRTIKAPTSSKYTHILHLRVLDSTRTKIDTRSSNSKHTNRGNSPTSTHT